MPRESRFSAFPALLTAVLILSCSSASGALEKHVGRAVDDDRAWQAGTSLSFAYYNLCTGWVWVWEGWEPNDVIGVTYSQTSPVLSLNGTWWFFGTGSPAGYGFTGTVEIRVADSDRCPVGGGLATQSFLPVSGWNAIDWVGGVSVGSGQFSVTFQFGPGSANPATLWTDHPAAGPTGPPACWSCYPNPRDTRSFYFGTAASPLCPGSPLNDGVCNAEFLQDVQAVFNDVVEPRSWSTVKHLYR